MEILEKNLEALSLVQPKLVQRISWPVNGAHIIFGENDETIYRLHSSDFVLTVTEDQLHGISEHVENANIVFLFGVGLGEQVDYLLGRFPEKQIMVWDRDPWLLRLFLMQKDYTKQLTSEHLKIYMCADLINLIPRMGKFTVLFHPLLKDLYHNEAEIINTGIEDKRILVNAGGLFVDDVVQSLKDLGYTPFYLSLRDISTEEIEYAIIQILPSIVFSINYQNGLSELCSKFSLKLLCWEIDPSVDVPASLSIKNKQAYIFTYCKVHMDDFFSAGFDNVNFLPLAANSKNRKPIRLSGEERKTYSCPISFVGSSLVEQAQRHMKTLTNLYEEYCEMHAIPCIGADEHFKNILNRQNEDYSTYRVPELAQEGLKEFFEYFHQKMGPQLNPIILLAESAASEKRLAYLSRLGRHGIKVWGDEGLRVTENYGAKYMGFAGHKYEINKIYSSSLINVDINRIYQTEMVNMRIFDIMACGGFVLAEYSEDLRELFELDQEVVAFCSLDELVEKTEYYLANKNEARQIAQNGMIAVRDRHTIEKRVEEMLSHIE